MLRQKQVGGSAKRMDELDFLKAVFILLMVAFHLVYIGNKYPYAKAVVYTFHMPGFLLISGYLANTQKTVRKFLRGMGRLLLPYLIMEGAYIILAAFLPIREHIDSLTVGTFLQHLWLKPLGPYWYLHTLVICSVMYFAIMRLPLLANWMKWTFVLFAYGALAFGLHLISFTHACILQVASPYAYCIKILSVFFASDYGVLSLLPHCCFGLISCIAELL